MFKALYADKDTYITNKYVNSIPAKSGNVGIAGSLDLFKLYGITQILSGNTKIPQTELSRVLIHFDLDPIRNLVNAGKIDVTHSSFKCHLELKDVYGGQTTPSNFTLSVFPLSSSFDEGLGKDTAYFADNDRSNFLSASEDRAWNEEGCSKACFATGSGDFITSSISLAQTAVTQFFKTGEEDLLVDVTEIVSSTLAGELPDAGFRISYSENLELDSHTYFVKRFGSRHAYDESKRPRLLVRFDDSISDDTSNLYFDNSSNLFLYSYVNGQLENLVSASASLTGSNCLVLQLQTPVSGGIYSLFFTGSQHSFGSNYTNGIYYAPVVISSLDPNIKPNIDFSGSIKFTPVWQSLDGSLPFVTGSQITAHLPIRTSKKLSPRRYTVNVLGVSSDYSKDENVTLRVNIFDENDPIIVAKKVPIVLPSIVIKNSYYAVRDSITNEYIIPFDTLYNSTKLSSDSAGMYLTLDTASLFHSRDYVIDLLISIDGTQQKFLNASPVFRIKNV